MSAALRCHGQRKLWHWDTSYLLTISLPGDSGGRCQSMYHTPGRGSLSVVRYAARKRRSGVLVSIRIRWTLSLQNDSHTHWVRGSHSEFEIKSTHVQI